ncbi:MAG TPA: Hsp70 family protein, partial [Phycisphaerales bacterium]|nr:Hsp70 family protein [Phycisphaerales bacterium]
FSTAVDSQPSVQIVVLQGEREFAKDNRELGKFELSGIDPAPRGVPQIEVEFALDANGILTVTAADKGTGKKADIKISNSGGLDKAEIDRMKRDAEAHAAEDKKRREVVDLKNKADHFLIQTRKSLDEHGAKVSQESRGKIESAISALETAIKGEDKDSIERALKSLETASYDLGKAVYEAEAAKAGASGPGAAGGPAASEAEPKPSNGASAGGAATGDVIDADFEVKDSKK